MTPPLDILREWLKDATPEPVRPSAPDRVPEFFTLEKEGVYYRVTQELGGDPCLREEPAGSGVWHDYHMGKTWEKKPGEEVLYISNDLWESPHDYHDHEAGVRHVVDVYFAVRISQQEHAANQAAIQKNKAAITSYNDAMAAYYTERDAWSRQRPGNMAIYIDEVPCLCLSNGGVVSYMSGNIYDGEEPQLAPLSERMAGEIVAIVARKAVQ